MRLSQINAMAQNATDYRALVCIFLFGGNDGHNLLVPMSGPQSDAYKSIRGSLALPDGNAKLLTVTTASGEPYGLNDGLSDIQPLWLQGKLAAVANVGMLVQPTTRAQFQGGAPVPTNLFSHSDAVQQMQAGTPNGSGGTGWAGRVADAMQSANAGVTFPPAISMAGPVLFCTGSTIKSASLIPNFNLTLTGMDFWPASAASARMAGYQQILTLDSGMSMIQAANKVRQDAVSLSAMLKNLASGPALTTVFPGTDIGQQLNQVAKIIQLRSQTGAKRQVFFCGLGGFDTHGSQSYSQWALLKQLGAALAAFYNATVEMGIADKVTAFTESDFGRTLQPSGSGSDHGWGNHHIVLGAGVKGGNLYGAFPTLALGGPDDSGSRGAMIPTTSIDQYGATLARWFGVPQAGLNAIFPNLANFLSTDVGFMV